MTLLDSELSRIRAELGFNDLNVGAEPYIGITAYFEQVVVPNLRSGAIASSSTVVTAAGVPTSVTLTLDSATGFQVYQRVIVDVDELGETSTVQAVSGSTITIPLKKAHSGTYPVAVESGEMLVRYYLARCRDTADRINEFGERAGVRSVDKEDAVFFGGKGEHSGLVTLQDLLQYWRSQLCTLLFGVGDISQFRSGGRSGGARAALY